MGYWEVSITSVEMYNLTPDRNEYLNSKPGRQTAEAQEMDSVTS